MINPQSSINVKANIVLDAIDPRIYGQNIEHMGRQVLGGLVAESGSKAPQDSRGFRLDVLNLGLVILGSGDERIQKAIQKAGERHPGRVGIRIGFDEALAHRIIAGADLFLIPSRYEPCGLTQMYAMKYGTVPVVRATGGLEDTVIAFNPRTGQGNGFKFRPYDPKAFYAASLEAVNLFRDSETWRDLTANGMNEDFSWDRAARAYLEIYRSVLKE